MAWQELQRKIESEEFTAMLNVASTSKAYLTGLNEQPAFKELTQLLRDSFADVNEVVRRIRALATVEIDPHYENPYDSALAAYVWALAVTRPNIARVAAVAAVSARQTWWGREVATQVLDTIPTSLVNRETENAVFCFVSTEPELRATTASTSVQGWVLSGAMKIEHPPEVTLNSMVILNDSISVSYYNQQFLPGVIRKNERMSTETQRIEWTH